MAEITAQPLQSAVALNRLPRLVFWATRGSLAVLDQGLVAISNFGVGIFLARWLSPGAYGSYALAFSIFLLLSMIFQALILEPQQVFGPSDYGDSKREYLGLLLWIHSRLALAIVVALGISAWLMHALAAPDGLPQALAGVTFAAPCVLLLWLARGACYVRLSPQSAVAGAGTYCVVLFVSLTFVYWVGLLSPFSAFIVIGLAALTSSIVLLVRLRPVLRMKANGPSRRLILQQHWKYGRFILVSLVLSWLTTEIFYPLLGTFSGMAAVGALKVLLNFSLPLLQSFAALSMIVLPYASREYHENGITALSAFTWKMTGLFTVAATAYWVAIISFKGLLIRTLYGSHYTELSSLIPLVAAGWLPWNIACVSAIALRAMRSPTSILSFYGTASAVCVVIGIPATWKFGLRGALWTIVFANSAALVVAVTLLRLKVKASVNTE